MIEVVKAGVEAIPEVQELVRIIWPATYDSILPPGQSPYMLNLIYSTGALQEQLQDGHQFIIARENDRAVGFASYAPKNESPKICKLHKIYVLPNQQGKGIGKALINYILDAIRSSCTRLQLNVNRQNPAINFYQKLGFSIIETVDISIGNGYFMNDFVMEFTAGRTGYPEKTTS